MDALAAYDDSDDEQQSSEDEQKQQQPRDPAAHAGGHALSASAIGPAPRPAAAAAAVSSLPPPDFDGASAGGDARWVKPWERSAQIQMNQVQDSVCDSAVSAEQLQRCDAVHSRANS